MNNSEKNLVDTVEKNGAARAAVVSVDKITFRREFRAACEQNSCGKYGKCWTCPPDVGDIDEMTTRAKTYKHALIFQTIGQLEDSFDIENMQQAAKKHNALILSLIAELTPALESSLILGAGSCKICERCAKAMDKPCQYPKKAIVSLEAYGIDVTDLAALAGMNYINGANTVTYFGGFFYK